MEENNLKEVSLFQLIAIIFQWIKKILTNFIQFVGKSLQLLYKFKWVTLSIVILCVAAGLYFSRPNARIYKVEAMAVLHGGDVQTLKEICKQLENSLATNDYLSLATKMGIPDSVSRKFFAIRTFDVIDYLGDGTADKIDFKRRHALDDTMNVKMKDRLYIQIRTQSIQLVPAFQEALVKYFTSHPILSSQFEAQKKFYADQIKICDAELQRIDSLAKVFYFKDNIDQIKFENNKLIVGESRKQLFYGELLEINSRKVWSENKLAECVLPVDFPSNFVVIPNAVNSRFKMLVIALFGSVVLSLLFAFLFDNLKNIVNFLENKKE